MERHTSATIRKPCTDDRPLWDVLLGVWGYPAVFVAYDLKLFPLLAEQPHTLPEVGTALNLAHRPAETLLAVCASVGLVQVQDGRYALTPLAEDYLLDSSPTSFSGYMDWIITNYSTWSFHKL